MSKPKTTSISSTSSSTSFTPTSSVSMYIPTTSPCSSIISSATTNATLSQSSYGTSTIVGSTSINGGINVQPGGTLIVGQPNYKNIRNTYSHNYKGKAILFERSSHYSFKNTLCNGIPCEFNPKKHKILIDTGYLDTSKIDLTETESFNLGGTILCLSYDTTYDILEFSRIKNEIFKKPYLDYLYKDNFMVNHNANLEELTEDTMPVSYSGIGITPSIPSVVAHLSGILNKDWSSKLRVYYNRDEKDSRYVTIYDKSLLRPAQRKLCGMYSYLKLKPKEEVYKKACEYFNSEKSLKSLESLENFVQSVCIPETVIYKEFISEIESQIALNIRVHDITTCTSIVLTNLIFSSLDWI